MGMSWSETDEKFMRAAIGEAKVAASVNEVPVGAVVVKNGEIIGAGLNRSIQDSDPTAHAEMVAIRAAALAEKTYRLTDTTLYVTLEPCVMCAGALNWSQIDRIVYGASDEKRGYCRCKPSILHPKTKVTTGIMAEESRELLLNFFDKKR